MPACKRATPCTGQDCLHYDTCGGAYTDDTALLHENMELRQEIFRIQGEYQDLQSIVRKMLWQSGLLQEMEGIK